MSRRRLGQVVAGLVALGSLSWAAWASYESAIPALRVYDGYWMMLGATIAFLIVAPLVWRWPRERSLVAITLITVIGSVTPIVVSAVRHGMPLKARLWGSWILGGADLVAPALVIGFVSLWFAVREYGSPQPTRRAGSAR